ncbi:MAG: RluA family pseudouridine synthase [Candidatus Kerfeldbacteria bacterium]|nr:RluA family pseudouridine synthase [Candidatus Kerfeldbacteria bacterium]
MVSAHRLLKDGDRVLIKEVAAQPLPAAAAPSPTVLFENERLLVVNKPAGLIVHPGAGVHGPTLIDWLVKRAPSVTTVGDDPAIRPGIVHRLDRDVSGVMVIAKTQTSFKHLKQQFKNRTVEKEYLALVHGVPKQRSGTINFRIERSRRQHGRMRALPLLPDLSALPRHRGLGIEMSSSFETLRGPQTLNGRPKGEGIRRSRGEERGRQAVTRYTVERVFNGNALLRIQLETGRTHQIRVHLKALGHPIVGDTVYTTKPARRKSTTLSRPWLHAARLKFQDLDGTTREFEAPLPRELKAYLQSGLT